MKAILFDIDGVLLDSVDANINFFQNFFEKAGYRRPLHEEFSNARHFPMIEVIRTFVNKSEEEVKEICETARSEKAFYDIEMIKMPERAGEIITKLAKNYTLGIVTSRSKKGVYLVPELAKLESLFQVVITYEDTKNHKPYPEPLLLAAERLGIQPNECVYVGDTEADMQAAKDAGMEFILFNKENVVNAKYHVTNFSDIFSIKSLF